MLPEGGRGAGAGGGAIGGPLVATNCADLGRCVLHTDETLRRACDSVAARWAAAGTLAEKRTFEQAHGLVYAATGLMWEPLVRPYVRPATQGSYDWMHVWARA